jgi:anion-transporting  ArsA/GET3 family ATPase
MMLDAKRTFDELIGRMAANPSTREQILANPIYSHLSTAVTGSQEYTAIAKLFELARQGNYDTIVLDTPPSRSAIEFLEAPERLIGFLEGGAAAPFIRPTGRAARAASLVFMALRRITGVGLLDDLTAFFGLLGGLLAGFHARAADVGALLRDPATGFLIVTSPERAPLDEAIFFASELERLGMRRCGVILNRVHHLDQSGPDVALMANRLQDTLGRSLACRVAQTHADVQVLAHRDQAALQRLRDALDEMDPVCLADRESDVHDIAALVDLRRELFSSARQPLERRGPAGQARRR